MSGMNGNRNDGNKSVFVTDLSVDTNEALLTTVFANCGLIRSVRICRDSDGQSLGYGYVNFGSPSEASHAVTTKNFTQINGKQIRVMTSQTDPNERNSSDANVFVKNLDKSVDNKRLYEIFKVFGKIISSKVAQEVNGLSKGFAFVKFESQQSAINAIKSLNGRQLDGKTLFCSKFQTKTERNKYLNTNKIIAKSYANIYVKNLSQEFDDNLLKKFFITFGKVMAAQVVHKQSKSFGFVALEDSSVADRAVRAMNGKPLPNGNVLYVTRALKVMQKKPPKKQLAQNNYKGNGVYVKYLNNSFDGQSLTQMFSPFGSITSAKVFSTQKNSIQLYNSFGFVCFATQGMAQKAVQAMNNTIVLNKPLFVSTVQALNERNSDSMVHRLQRIGGMSDRQPLFSVRGLQPFN